MIERLKALFRERDSASGEEHARGGFDELEMAAAALMIEAATLDGEFAASERARVVALLRRRFELAAEAGEALVEAAESRIAAAPHLHGYTRVVKESLDHDERIEVLEMLWDVIYADGELHDFEANLMRRIAGLLHVPDRDSGAARKRVLRKRGLPGGAPRPRPAPVRGGERSRRRK